MEIILKYICFCIFVTSINGTENTTVLNEIKHSEDNLKDISYKEIDEKFNYKFNKLQHDFKTLNIKTLELEDKNLKLKERLTKTEENLKNHKEELNSFQPCVNSDWTAYEDEKCFRIFPNKFETRHEAEKTCNQEYLKTDISIPTLVSIKSAPEQEFLTKFVFDQFEVGDNVWTGAKRRTGNDSQFVSNDGSNINFTNWAEGSPSEQIGSDCVRMQSKWTKQNSNISTFDEGFIGKWINVPCDETSVVLCQKLQVLSVPQLQKTLLDTRHELTNTRNHLDNTENQLKNTKNQLDNTENQLKNTINQLDNTRVGQENTKKQLDNARKELMDLKALVISGEFNGKIFLHPKSASERVGNFLKCQLICQEYNATTVKIHSAEENDFLWMFLRHYMEPWYDGAYLGGSIYDTSDELTWLDHSPVDYVKWRLGEPDDKVNQKCMIIGWAEIDGGYWDNFWCYGKRALIICQKMV